MRLQCISMFALLVSQLAGGIVESYTFDCSPEQFEIHFKITGLENDQLVTGFGQVHHDVKDKNVTLLNITVINKEDSQTILYLSDKEANRTYVFNTSTGKCALDQDMDGGDLDYVRPVNLGLGADKLEAMIFESQSGVENVTMIVSKNLCIPIQAQFESDSSLKVLSFFNATIGIKDPKVLHIPEVCRGGI